ncbi:hypothetical protein Glove_88g9 [Diversispora epigaea]|uniref:Uncharacterized protein n=1 Tax=Diversispora epigaea TaxID=1348612 RepID=A0A397J6J4_9GLOM|nr:hypothetical protein Glove_88g9 [Diversispora epigaea]
MPTNILNKTLPKDNNDAGSKTTYKLIKVFTSTNYENRKHQQLFFNITNSANVPTLTPVYCREVIRTDKQQDLYWYNAALKEVPRPKSSQLDDNNNNSTDESSLPITIWAIHPAKLKFLNFLKLIKRRPKKFNISCTRTGIQSSFEYGREKNEPLGYSGEINVPFDDYCIQRYRWVRYGDGSKWVFIFKNDPRTPLAEFRRTSLENEFIIVFLEDAPLGWNSKTVDRSSRPREYMGSPLYPSGFTVESFSPSIFSQYSQYSQYSRYSELSYSKESNKYLSGSISPSSLPPMSPLNSTFGVTDFLYDDDDNSLDKYWQEYVLASTVTIQDEVNSRKNSLRK